MPRPSFLTPPFARKQQAAQLRKLLTKDSDLTQVTVKKLISDLGEHFKVDMKPLKEFIRAEVTTILQEIEGKGEGALACPALRVGVQERDAVPR